MVLQQRRATGEHALRHGRRHLLLHNRRLPGGALRPLHNPGREQLWQGLLLRRVSLRGLRVPAQRQRNGPRAQRGGLLTYGLRDEDLYRKISRKIDQGVSTFCRHITSKSYIREQR